MSHFTVAVITPSRPSDEDLAAVMQPFHEFECTGTDDQYVQNVDITEDARAEYAADTTRRYRDPAGTLHDPYEDRFYRDPLPTENPGFGTGGNGKIAWTSKDWGDGRGYRPKVHFVPDGWDDIRVPTPEVQTFAEWLEGYYGLKPVLPGGHEKHGFVEVSPEGEVLRAIKRTNPNAKWDWWQVGGRWDGLLALRDGVFASQACIADIDPTRRGFDANEPLRTFAVLHNGQWFARGEMGWFAAVSDAKPDDQWNEEFAKLLADNPDAWLTVVDCHI
jgi:hypothetical protein